MNVKKSLLLMPLLYAGTELCIDRPLFDKYSGLYRTLPCVQFGMLPIPIMRLKNLEKRYDNKAQLFIKDDGMTGAIDGSVCSFGGNKIRKLEFLLADALAHGADSILTYGAIGSNHVVATGASCKQVGLQCTALLTPQDVTNVVKRNMLLMRQNNVEMILNPNAEMRNVQKEVIFTTQVKGEKKPYFIPTGGSNKIGAIGFVNAAFELKNQVEQGDLPEPDYIYVATGSCGTVAGLTLGLRAAGLLQTQVRGFVVEPDNLADPFIARTLKLILDTNAFLHEKDDQFPLYKWSREDVHLSFDYSGADYGIVTSETTEAIALFKQEEDVLLDTTYTGKAAAALIDHLAQDMLNGKVVLFWKTFCSQVAEPSISFEQLAPEFQSFFKE